MTEPDRFEQMLKAAAKSYHAPPETPRDALWARIQEARAASRPGSDDTAGVLPLTPRKRWMVWAVPTGIAALIALGIGIGRITAPTHGNAPDSVTAAVRSTPEETKSERRELAMKLVATEYLTRADALLTEFKTNTTPPEFAGHARELLTTTRLLLDSKQITDPKLRGLLEDLELVLVQLATLPDDHRAEERRFIADGMAQRQLRSRLHDAIPAGAPARL